MKILEVINNENWLYNGDTFGKKVYLGENDEVGNWKEISNEEKDEIELQAMKEIVEEYESSKLA